MLHTVPSTRSYVLDMQGNDFESFCKHSYDIKNRPDNSELEKHFHKSHNLIDDLNVVTLQNNITTAAA